MSKLREQSIFTNHGDACYKIMVPHNGTYAEIEIGKKLLPKVIDELIVDLKAVRGLMRNG